MIIHIVRNNETVNEILDNYHLTINDLRTNNQHVTDFKNIQSGTKLKIPFLSEENKQILKTSEPFIQDYYPTVEKYGFEPKEENKIEEVKKVEEVNKIEDVAPKPSTPGIKYVMPPQRAMPPYNNWYYRRNR